MYFGNIKKDFDKLRGGITFIGDGNRIGVSHSAVQHILNREYVIADSALIRFDRFRGSGIHSKGRSVRKRDHRHTRRGCHSYGKPTRSKFQICRRHVSLSSCEEDTIYRLVSSSGMLKAIETEGG